MFFGYAWSFKQFIVYWIWLFATTQPLPSYSHQDWPVVSPHWAQSSVRIAVIRRFSVVDQVRLGEPFADWADGHQFARLPLAILRIAVFYLLLFHLHSHRIAALQFDPYSAHIRKGHPAGFNGAGTGNPVTFARRSETFLNYLERKKNTWAINSVDVRAVGLLYVEMGCARWPPNVYGCISIYVRVGSLACV